MLLFFFVALSSLTYRDHGSRAELEQQERALRVEQDCSLTRYRDINGKSAARVQQFCYACRFQGRTILGSHEIACETSAKCFAFLTAEQIDRYGVDLGWCERSGR